MFYGLKTMMMVSIAMTAFLAGCGSNGGTGSDTLGTDTYVPPNGPLNGTWKMETSNCNGTDLDLTNAPETLFIVDGDSGTITNEFCTIPASLSYPSADSVVWEIHKYDCGQAGSSDGGDKRNFTYSISGDTLTVTEEKAPADDYSCPGGKIIMTWSKI